MDFQKILEDPEMQMMFVWGLATIAILILFAIIYKKIKRARRRRVEKALEVSQIKADNQDLSQEIRNRIIENINTLARIIRLNPVIPGHIPEDTTLESRCRTKCLDMIIEALPRDIRGQGIRMAEYIHHLSDNLVHAYGRDGLVTVLIDVQPLILNVDSAAHVGLMLNELISNALQYAPVPGEKSKVNIIFKERDNKLFISVGDNGIGMKSPYIPQFSFGLQLVNTLVEKYKGKLIITSRPGTRVEIALTEYQKAAREVYVTPTTKVY